jgi:hypothetical protein
MITIPFHWAATHDNVCVLGLKHGKEQGGVRVQLAGFPPPTMCYPRPSEQTGSAALLINQTTSLSATNNMPYAF